jgi:hypothetical protein
VIDGAGRLFDQALELVVCGRTGPLVEHLIARLGDDEIQAVDGLLTGSHRRAPLFGGAGWGNVAIPDKGVPAGQDRQGRPQLVSQYVRFAQ